MLLQNLKLAEKLAKTNLRIEFLTACRRAKLTPRFIQDSLKTMQKAFSSLRKFDDKCSDFAKYLLNGSIAAAFEEKAYLERKQKRFHQDLCNLDLVSNVYNWMKDKCRQVYCSTIDDIRPGQLKKFRVLQNNAKRRNRDSQQGYEPENPSQAPEVARVNNLSSSALDPTTESLLANGPKFGITPRVDRQLLTDVEKNIERFVYGKRWIDEIERAKRVRNRNAEERGLTRPQVEDEADAQAVDVVPERQHVASAGSLFGSARFPDVNKTQPPVSTRETEEQLGRLKNSILRIYKQHGNSVCNVADEELQGLDKLRKDSGIVIKPSDKCKGLVILDKSDYVNKANHILEDESNYTKLDRDETSKIEASTKRIFKQTVRDKLPANASKS